MTAHVAEGAFQGATLLLLLVVPCRAVLPAQDPDPQALDDVALLHTIDSPESFLQSLIEGNRGSVRDRHGLRDSTPEAPIAPLEDLPGLHDTIQVDTAVRYDRHELQRAAIYPAIARRSGVEGKVELRLLIDVDGRVRDLRVIRCDPRLFESSATRAVLSIRFSAARRGGVPVASWTDVTILYRLGD